MEKKPASPPRAPCAAGLPDYARIGLRIQERRAMLKMTPSMLSEATGIKERRLGDLETAAGIIKFHEIHAIARALGVKIEFLSNG